jgi:glycosyltransferase involved in cell wall biosynthesis
MNIGFDAKRAFFNRTGLGNYSRNLIMALAAYASDNRYQLFTPRPKSVHHFRNLPDTNNIDIISPEGKMPQGLWRAYGLTKLFDKYSTELYHGLSAELPFNIGLSRVKRVVTIHDLIFLRFPELYPAIDRFIYKKKTIHACRNADHIIAISQQTKRDLINFLSISPEKISVVYQNCDPQFTTPIAPEAIEAVRTKFNLPKDFILNVGTLEKRKNAAVIIEALAQLERKMPLVLVGKATDYLEQLHTLVKQHRLQRQVIFLHDVGYADLPALYRAASIFAYPSIFEGFGIPIIEAL